jgi:predicted dienelactone hydrolase
VVIVALLAAGMLLASLWREHTSGLTLPEPTGPFAVGRKIYDWVDSASVDTLTPVPGMKRELLVWIWYPCVHTPSASTAEYMPAPLRAALERNRPPLVGSLLTRDLSMVQAHSVPGAAVSPQERAYPVAIMRAGASLEVVNYSTLAEDLASHGYIVVGFDAPYRTGVVAFPDGRVILRTPQNNPELVSGEALEQRVIRLQSAWTADVGFVLDRLTRWNGSVDSGQLMGRLDMTRVGVLGHSFGGATAAEFCSQDARCKAGIDIDGSLHGSVIREGIHKPFMFLVSGQGDFSTDAEVRQIKADIQSVYDRLPPNGRPYVSIRGANHFTFTDDGALLKSGIIRGALRTFGVLGMDGRRQLVVTAYCVRSFFDAYLKGAGDSRLSITSARYPEVQIVE